MPHPRAHPAQASETPQPDSPELRPRDPAEIIHVFGDSHAKYFFRTGFYAQRHGLAAPLRYRIAGQYIPASSVAGFRRATASSTSRTPFAKLCRRCTG